MRSPYINRVFFLPEHPVGKQLSLSARLLNPTGDTAICFVAKGEEMESLYNEFIKPLQKDAQKRIAAYGTVITAGGLSFVAITVASAEVDGKPLIKRVVTVQRPGYTGIWGTEWKKFEIGPVVDSLIQKKIYWQKCIENKFDSALLSRIAEAFFERKMYIIVIGKDSYKEQGINGIKIYFVRNKEKAVKTLEAILMQKTYANPKVVSIDVEKLKPDYIKREYVPHELNIGTEDLIDAFVRYLKAILNCGGYKKPRGIGTIEVCNIKISVRKHVPSLQDVYKGDRRVEEVLHCIGMTRDELIKYINAFIKGEKPEGIPYTYGDRIRRPIDQLCVVAEKLAKDPDCRDAVIRFSDRNEILSEDPACIERIHFFIRNGKLCISVSIRSQDAYKAFIPNAYIALAAAEEVRRYLREKGISVDIGEIVFYVESGHIYIRDINDARATVEYLEKYKSYIVWDQFNAIINVVNDILKVQILNLYGEIVYQASWDLRKFNLRSRKDARELARILSRMILENVPLNSNHIVFLSTEVYDKILDWWIKKDRSKVVGVKYEGS